MQTSEAVYRWRGGHAAHLPDAMTYWELSARTLVLATLAAWRVQWPLSAAIDAEARGDLEQRLITGVALALEAAARERPDG